MRTEQKSDPDHQGATKSSQRTIPHRKLCYERGCHRLWRVLRVGMERHPFLPKCQVPFWIRVNNLTYRFSSKGLELDRRFFLAKVHPNISLQGCTSTEHWCSFPSCRRKRKVSYSKTSWCILARASQISKWGGANKPWFQGWKCQPHQVMRIHTTIVWYSLEDRRSYNTAISPRGITTKFGASMPTDASGICNVIAGPKKPRISNHIY